MKKSKKVILKGNAEAIKKYTKQKFVDKGLEYLGSIIGIIIGLFMGYYFWVNGYFDFF